METKGKVTLKKMFKILIIMIVTVNTLNAQLVKIDSIAISIIRDLKLPHLLKYGKNAGKLPIIASKGIMDGFNLRDTIVDSLQINFFINKSAMVRKYGLTNSKDDFWGIYITIIENKKNYLMFDFYLGYFSCKRIRNKKTGLMISSSTTYRILYEKGKLTVRDLSY